MLSALPTIGLLLPSQYDDYSARSGIDDYLIAILLHTIFITIGVVLGYIIFNDMRLPNWQFRKKLPPPAGDITPRLVIAISVVSFALLIDQLLRLGTVPLLLVFSDAAGASFVEAREIGYKNRGGLGVYFWHFNRMVFVPFLVASAYLMASRSKTIFSWLVFGMTLTLGVIHNGLSGASAPVAMLFLILFVAFINSGGKIRMQTVFLAVIAIFSFPLFVEQSFSDVSLLEALDKFIEKIVWRFGAGTFDRTLSYFDYYPYVEQYLGGSSIKVIAALSGDDFVNTRNVIFLSRAESLRDYQLSGNANAHFIGYMNADGGLFLVAFSCLLVGVILGAFDAIAASRIRSIFGLSLYCVMAFIFWKLSGSQPTTVLFSHGAGLSLILILLLERRHQRGFRTRRPKTLDGHPTPPRSLT